jgi:hypothetical protein
MILSFFEFFGFSVSVVADAAPLSTSVNRCD